MALSALPPADARDVLPKYLVGYNLDLEHSELLYSFDEFRPEDWTIFKHGSQPKWEFRGKTLAGGGLAESKHGQVFYKTPVKGDVVMEFDARTIAPSYHDIVWLWGARFDEDPWNAGFLGCLGGWWDDLAGIESLNTTYVPSAIHRNAKLEPGRWYHVISGTVKGVNFIVVDGKLVTRYATPPQPEREGYFGLGFYESYCEYANLKVWRPAVTGAPRQYAPAKVPENRIEGEVVDMNVDGASCRVALTGARVLSFVTQGKDYVWHPRHWNVTTSREWAHGGIPLCWPWFGSEADGVDRGFGGFAYFSSFEVRRREQTEKRSTLVLGLRDSAATRRLWDFAFDFEVSVVLEPTSLSVSLKTKNLSDREMRLNAGFHPYLDVGDRMLACLEGVKGADWELSGERFELHDDTLPPNATYPCELSLAHSVDDIFVIPNARLRLRAPATERSMEIEAEGTRHVVVYVLPPEKEDRAWRAPVCVEPCTYWYRSARVVAPGAQDETKIRIAPVRE